MTNSPYHRSAFGVEVRSTMIYERTLELAHNLCWNSEDLGISRVYKHNDHPFKPKSALQRSCRDHGEVIDEPQYYFDWLKKIKERSGRDRQRYLRDEHWCNREQVINILLDTAMQGYLKESRELLSSLTNTDFNNAELVKFDIRNQAREYTGAPDSTYIDLESKNIILIEIKIGKSTTKYSLDQNVKYETMSALLRSARFFPNFTVHQLLLGPSPKFSENTRKVDSLRPSTDSEGRISFDYDTAELTTMKPVGNAKFSDLLAARLGKLSKGVIAAPKYGSPDGISFFSWREVERRCPAGMLRDNISALMQYLAPSRAA